MARHILARRGETLSALVKYLSNRAFHSREWRREGIIGKASSKGNDGQGRQYLEASHPLSLSVRYRAKARTTTPTKVQSRFYCPSLEGSLSTFLCPAEIHDARKCLLKISISASPVSLSLPPSPLAPFSHRSVLLFYHYSRWFIFPLFLERKYRDSFVTYNLINSIRNHRNSNTR